ncbi:hypothetical protein V1512DRAFT_260571 [Lipomyces arxii]|uniref:uncharacterized protein n=1 Tax=Lipomyces arxii TaxID=56418 RepID=UPI0034CEBE7D
MSDYGDSPDSGTSESSLCHSPETIKKRRESLSLPLAPGVLPPRKRAKTAVEKEQRRIERILRNRQAAQSSREKKRKQLEELEVINDRLVEENKLAQERLVNVELENKSLKSKLAALSSQLDAMKEMFNSDKMKQEKVLDYRIKTETSLFDFPIATTLQDQSSMSDAMRGVDFKEMHHPEAVVSFLDLQRPLKYQQPWGPLMIARLVTMIAITYVTAGWTVYSLTSRLRPNTRSSLSYRRRRAATQAISPCLTMLMRSPSQYCLTGTPSLGRLTSCLTSQQKREVVRRIQILSRTLQRRNQHQSQISKSFRPTSSQPSSTRRSVSRQMALAVEHSTAVATGLDRHRVQLGRLNNCTDLFSAMLVHKLCDFSTLSSDAVAEWSVSVDELRDLRRLSGLIENADSIVNRNVDLIGVV